jgi:hypothetical protein
LEYWREYRTYFHIGTSWGVQGVTTPSQRPYHQGHSPQTPLKKW